MSYSTAACYKGLSELQEEITASLMRLWPVREPLCCEMRRSSVLSKAQVSLPVRCEELRGCDQYINQEKFPA